MAIKAIPIKEAKKDGRKYLLLNDYWTYPKIGFYHKSYWMSISGEVLKVVPPTHFIDVYEIEKLTEGEKPVEEPRPEGKKNSIQVLMEQQRLFHKSLQELLPTEKDAMELVWIGIQRLKDLGWKDAIYCPKDKGNRSRFWECGCIGSAPGFYFGEWPNGTWFIEDRGDAWPSNPSLFRPMTVGEEDLEKEKIQWG